VRCTQCLSLPKHKQIEPLSGKLSLKKTKALFYNADTAETAALFAGLDQLKLEPIVEVRKEEPAINPYAHIDERNRELSEARLLAAEISDPNQVLLKGPTKMGRTETVSLDDLTPLVKQAAEAALLRRPKILKRR